MKHLTQWHSLLLPLRKVGRVFLLLLVFSANLFASGESIDSAILLQEGETVTFTSSANDYGRHVVYFKMQASTEGTITMHLSTANTYARWMEEGIEAYGSLRQNMFRDGCQFDVKPGHTYYATYNFAEATEATVSYTLQPAPEGSTRSTAYTIAESCTRVLRGQAPTQEVDGLVHTNQSTWFRLDGESLSAYDLLSVQVGGDNETSVSLYCDDQDTPLRFYMLGEGSGMLPLGTMLIFDVDFQRHTYYIAISQDDAGGTATFTFSKAQPGQSIASALEARMGQNSVSSPAWYRYEHQGEGDMVTIEGGGISVICDAQGNTLMRGNDARSGIRMRQGSVIYFQASYDFTIGVIELEPGLSSDKPLPLTLGQYDTGNYSFLLNGSAGDDVLRYVLFEATADGILMIGTTHKNVITSACGCMVRDVTTQRPVNVVQKQQVFDTTYFTYTFEVAQGHSYLIEHTLQDNYGEVSFLAAFTPAQEGESQNTAFTLQLGLPLDLGRHETSTRYMRFTAPASGDYLISAHVLGQVRVLGDEAHNISKDYENGTDFHREVVTLQEGQQLLLSATPSTDIEHLKGAGQTAEESVQDYFIPNYYIVVQPAQEQGIDPTSAQPLQPSQMQSVGQGMTWYTVQVPADEPLNVVLSDAGSSVAPILLADEQGRWITKESELSRTGQTYVLTPAAQSRTIYLVTNGLTDASVQWRYYVGTEEVTAIQSPSAVVGGRIYDLQGRPAQPRHGLYIIGGKKIAKK